MASYEYVPSGKLINPIPPPRSVRSLHPKVFHQKNFIPSRHHPDGSAVKRSTSVWSFAEKIDGPHPSLGSSTGPVHAGGP